MSYATPFIIEKITLGSFNVFLTSRKLIFARFFFLEKKINFREVTKLRYFVRTNFRDLVFSQRKQRQIKIFLTYI